MAVGGPQLVISKQYFAAAGPTQPFCVGLLSEWFCRFQPVSEGRITAPVMGSFTAGAAPGSPGGAGSAGTEPNPQHTITK